MGLERRIEVDYYNEIAKELVVQFKSNLADPKYIVTPLLGEISSSLRTLIANGYDASDALKNYANVIHRLHLDISILVENKETRKFEVMIFEIKKVANLGLTELSQLIGYCLVSKCKFGVLMNKAVSSEFSVILDADRDLSCIERVLGTERVTHKFGVMVWNSETLKVEYTNSGSIKSLPAVIDLIEAAIS